MIQKLEISQQLRDALQAETRSAQHATREIRIRSTWPGIQLYYPPIKYLPRDNRYETESEARERLLKYARQSEAHTLIFDLEDGCRQKSLSRQFLAMSLPDVRAAIPGRVAVRINPVTSPEHSLDLSLLKEIAPYVDDVMLAKAGEQHGIAELDKLGAFLDSLSPAIRIQPIIEHPRSLKIAGEIFGHQKVEHVVFGIHDFSRALQLMITAENWQDELYPFMCNLMVEARLAGKGIIGGVETLLLSADPPDVALIPEWLNRHAEANATIICNHARREASLGFTGKQVIHPNHIRLLRYGFSPGNEDLHRSLRILEEAIKANAFFGGAIRFEDEMMDPPMFAKALQLLMRSVMLGNQDTGVMEVVAGLIASLPTEKFPEIWPYPGWPPLAVQE